ncbi:MAG: Rieske 2Fe-2S domain-containing protein [Planctomycetaceae bacterium]|nr:Rieske 2Fe-2S domain-containing protein [Planctomycetaceae bacterium]
MAKEKLTTADILARARKQDAGASSGEAPAAPAPEAAEAAPAETPSVDTAPSAGPAPVKPKPASTADILAAARAGTAGSKPAGAAAKPTATSDILAAARAQTGGAAAAKPAAKPGSTADILAAARGGGAVAAGKPAAGAAAKAVPPKAAATAKPVGERPSVQEMVKAAREGVPAAAQSAPAKPRLPVSAAKKPDAASRRSFLGSAIVWVTEPFMAAWIAMGAIAAVWGLAAARFMMPNMIVEPPSRFKIGPPSDYPSGTVSTKWIAARGVWIVNTDQYDGRNTIYALNAVCTHLGCTPNWLDGEQKFKCPCHGSGFYITGINFEGPAPRPLERVGIRLADDGSLEVDKSVKFQEELGQWQDGSSYVELA